MVDIRQRAARGRPLDWRQSAGEWVLVVGDTCACYPTIQGDVCRGIEELQDASSDGFCVLGAREFLAPASQEMARRRYQLADARLWIGGCEEHREWGEALRVYGLPDGYISWQEVESFASLHSKLEAFSHLSPGREFRGESLSLPPASRVARRSFRAWAESSGYQSSEVELPMQTPQWLDLAPKASSPAEPTQRSVAPPAAAATPTSHHFSQPQSYFNARSSSKKGWLWVLALALLAGAYWLGTQQAKASPPQASAQLEVSVQHTLTRKKP